MNRDNLPHPTVRPRFSRGAVCTEGDDHSSEGEFEANPEYADYYANWQGHEEDESRSRMYRYAHNGILVYDEKARYSDSEAPCVQVSVQAREVTEEVRRDVEKCLEYGSCYLDRVKFLSSPAYPPQKVINEEFTLVVPSFSLRFDSKFESGNLSKVIMLSESDYELTLSYDIDTKGFTQWYYFSAVSPRPSHRVHFSIINLMKYESLYNNGLQPVVKVGDGSWERGGVNVSYYKNAIPRLNPNNNPKIPSHHYTLSFEYVFEEAGKVVKFAHCYPYTYTELRQYLEEISGDVKNAARLRIDTLCQSLAGNDCYLLTITDHIDSYPSWSEEESKMLKTSAGRKFMRQRAFRTDKTSEKEHRHKKGIILTARVHPGETNSSYMMKGAIDFLLSDCRDAAVLRRNFVFRLIPMLNPDGVVYGNYRCSLLGVDLNRRWKTPSRFLHPTVFFAKKFVQYFSEEHEVEMFCDMHGHSMKKNMFMYACSLRSSDLTDHSSNILIKMIPKLLSKANKLFSFKDSHFRVEACKLSTARVVVFKEMNILNSYTLEASFYGPEYKSQLSNMDPEDGEPPADSQMSTDHMESLGRDLCKVLLAFTSKRAFRAKLAEVTTALRDMESAKPRQSVTEPAKTELGDALAKAETCCSDDQPPEKPQVNDTLPTEEDCKSEEQLDVQSAIQVIGEAGDIALGKEEEDAESEGGSDSLGSDNDDQKQEFIYRKKVPKKPKRTGKKVSVPPPKREQKTRSCARKIQAEQCSAPVARPKTPFVFGNYREAVVPRASNQRNTNRIYKLCTIYTVKALHVDTPKIRRQPDSRAVPTEVLLSGMRSVEEPPKVKSVVGVGGLRNSMLPTCPSSTAISQDADLSLRIGRNSESPYRDPASHGRSGSKLSLRPLTIIPV